MATAEQIMKDVILLKPIEQAQLVDNLLSILDKPDACLDKLWANEAESRLKAYKRGELKSVPLDDVLSKYK